MKRLLVPLPREGCDPSEVAIPWKLLSQEQVEFVFITPDGKKAKTDPRMLNGDNLGLLKPILAARQDAVEAYTLLDQDTAFSNPLKYTEVQASDFDAIYLPGGHDKTVKEYLESKVLQQLIVDFFAINKTVAAICHGVVLVARSIDPQTNKSVLYNYKTTCLLKSQELMAYNITRLWLKDYYLTYPEITVEDEVTAALKVKDNFIPGPLPLLRDTSDKLARGFVVNDRNYLSARWPGDLYNFSGQLLNKLQISK
ncbi:type 1 glutamine amidotransferase domain-containing protein [Colwelliaceae bacterium BS250]